jgi:hypothetical protein
MLAIPADEGAMLRELTGEPTDIQRRDQTMPIFRSAEVSRRAPCAPPSALVGASPVATRAPLWAGVGAEPFDAVGSETRCDGTEISCRSAARLGKPDAPEQQQGAATGNRSAIGRLAGPAPAPSPPAPLEPSPGTRRRPKRQRAQQDHLQPGTRIRRQRQVLLPHQQHLIEQLHILRRDAVISLRCSRSWSGSSAARVSGTCCARASRCRRSIRSFNTPPKSGVNSAMRPTSESTRAPRGRPWRRADRASGRRCGCPAWP